MALQTKPGKSATQAACTAQNTIQKVVRELYGLYFPSVLYTHDRMPKEEPCRRK